MKRRFVAVLLSLCLIMAFIPVSAMAVEFDDTQDHWAEAAIDRWSDAGVVTGVGNNEFDPEGDLSRAQAASVFSKLLNLTDEADLSSFTDIPADAWYAGHIAKCVEAGIMAGVGNNQMDPEGTVTREMFFTMFAQAMGIEREDTMEKDFADEGQISDWAEGYINALVNRGFISGITDTTLVPGDDINRASVMALLNKAIVGYAVEDGAQNVDGTGIVLVLADNVSITADEPITVVVANEGTAVSLANATGDTEVVALENNVQVTDAPVGTTIAAREGVTGTTANGQTVAPDSEITITAPSTGGGGGGVTPPVEDTNEAEEAVKAAWEELNEALAQIKGHDGQQLVTAELDEETGTAALTLNVDAIMAGEGAFDDSILNGLATRIKEALDAKFGDYTLTVDGKDVYVEGEFQNTALKEALFSVADGFFYTLANIEEENGVYTFKSVPAKAAGEDSYEFNIDVNLVGDEVEKVKNLAQTLADHLQMETLNAETIKTRYGIEVNESEAAVVTMEMPDALMQKAADLVKGKGTSGDNLQAIFDRQTVGTFLSLMNSDEIQLDDILGSGADEINSVLTTVNSNANVINKVLSKLTVTVNGAEFFTETGFKPGTGDDAWHNFMDGVIGMTSEDIKAMTPSQFKNVNGTMSAQNYYAVPVTVNIDLEDSMGFSATETVVVVLHIDFSQYTTEDTTTVVQP